MAKIRQNLVILIEPNEDTFLTPVKIGNSFLNRFLIDEEAGFELLGMYYLHQSSLRMESTINPFAIAEKGMDRLLT